MRFPRITRPPGLAVAAGLAFLIVSICQAMGGRTSLQAFWRGYCTLVVSDAVPLGEVVRRLERGINAGRIVSAETSTVSVTTFSARENVTVAELERRLDSRDPRFDAYMRKLPAMFRAGGEESPSSVLYVRTGMTPLFFSLRVKWLLRGLEGEWSIPDLAPVQSMLCLLAASVYLTLIVAGARDVESRRVFALSALPWLLNCVFGSLADLLAFYLVFPFCCALMAQARLHMRRGGMGRIAELLGAGLLGSVAAMGAALVGASLLTIVLGGTRDVLRLLTALASDAVLVAALVAWDRGRSPQPAHRLFIPLSIGRRLYRAARLPFPRRRLDLRPLLASARGLVVTHTPEVVLLLAVAGLSPFVTFLGGGRGVASVPSPVRAGSPRVSWESLGRLWPLSQADELPTVADYVAHEAYQSGLAYGAAWGLPTRDERVTLAEFSSPADGPATVEKPRTVLLYDDRWLRSTLARSPRGSVGRLLVDQGRAARVLRSVQTAEPVQRPESWMIVVYSAMVVLFLVVGSHYLRPSLLSGDTRTALVRRGQQA